MSKRITKFMADTGYTDATVSFLGIQKFHKGKGRIDWDYKSPTEMLKAYDKWLKKNS